MLGSSRLNPSRTCDVQQPRKKKTKKHTSAQTLQLGVSMTAAKRTQRMCQGLMSPGTMAVVGPIISIPTVCFMTGKESGGLMCVPLASVLTHDPVHRIYKAKILGEPPPRW